MNPEMNNSIQPTNVPEAAPQENQENYPPPYPLGYDGAGVVSSHPQNYQIQEDQMTQPPQENQGQDENQQPESKNDNDVQSLRMLNQILAQELYSYQQFLGSLNKPQNVQPAQQQQQYQQQPNLSNDPLEQRLQQYKREALEEARYIMNQELQENRKVEELRKQNPDLVEDPIHEYFISNIAQDYRKAGWDFNSAADQAIKDYRIFLKEKAVNNQMNQPPQANAVNNQVSQANIPNARTTNPNAVNSKITPTKQVNSPGATHIEGTAIYSPSQSFKASELIDMQINRPSEYLRLQPQIMKAYQEGRVLLDE